MYVFNLYTCPVGLYNDMYIRTSLICHVSSPSLNAVSQHIKGGVLGWVSPKRSLSTNIQEQLSFSFGQLHAR